MKINPIEPPRTFIVGHGAPIEMKDCARVELEADEQVTFVTASGTEYDLARKSWGYYATPSLNGRLAKFGLQAVLIKSTDLKFYVYLVEKGKEADFHAYLEKEKNSIVCWLNTNEVLLELEQKMRAS